MRKRQVQQFVTLWLPASIRSAPLDVQRRGRLLIYAAAALAFTAFAFGLQVAVLGTSPGPIPFAIAGTIAASAPLVLRATGSLLAAGTVLCLVVASVVGFASFIDWGLHDGALVYVLALPWLGAFVIGPRGGWIGTGIAIFLFGGFYALHASGHPFPRVTPGDEQAFFLFASATSVALLSGFIAWLYEGMTLQNLREREERYRIVSELTSDFAFVLEVDPRGHWTPAWVTAAFERITGHDPCALEGEQGVLSLVHPDDVPLAREVFTRLMAGGRAECEMRIVRADGEVRWLDVSARAEHDAGGRLVRVLGGAQDVTDRMEYEMGLVAAREQAEALERMKTNLLLGMGHELRTPLNAVLAGSELLRMDAPEALQDDVGLVEAGGQRLLRTVEAVLTLAELSSGVEARREEVDAAKLVRRVSTSWAARASDAGLAFEIETPGAPALVRADEERLRRVLEILLDNALKFTQRGCIGVAVEVDAGVVALSVSDTGRGVPEHALEAIFEPFRQASDGLARTHEGAGLGLAVARGLAESMHGTLGVESREGQGSRFTLRVPGAMGGSLAAAA